MNYPKQTYAAFSMFHRKLMLKDVKGIRKRSLNHFKYPLAMTNIVIENGPLTVDLPTAQ